MKKIESKKAESKKSQPAQTRLNVFISHNAPYSRREADRLIESGRVNIERRRAKLGDVVRENERVFIDGKQIFKKKEDFFTTIIYHKPKGELVSKSDSRGRRVIYDSLGSEFKGFSPVGRLDFASEGLLILSDSKKVVKSLMQSDLEREYIIKINRSINKDMIFAMENGLKIESKKGAHKLNKIESMELAAFVDYKIIKNERNFSRLKVTIKEGKNRELRRFFANFDAMVLDLRRVRFGFIHLNALPVGKTRFLNSEEYKALHEFLDSNKN